MYWKIDALTAKRNEITQCLQGTLPEIKDLALTYQLEIVRIRPDYLGLWQSLWKKRRCDAQVLAVFFKDFADMRRCGLSVPEAIHALLQTISYPILKEALMKMKNALNDGHSLQEAMENTRVFPKIACITVSTAEKTGQMTELLDVLAQFFKYKAEKNQRVIKSLIYPVFIFILLSFVSVFITINLLPQINSFMPEALAKNWAAQVLVLYADFLKKSWWLIPIGIVLIIYIAKFCSEHYQEKFLAFIFKIPLGGDLMKNMILAQIFLSLYVYLKSGVNIVDALQFIHQVQHTYISNKLMLLRQRIFKGLAISEAFKEDNFFPPFIYQHLSKGQVGGYQAVYFERIYQYYDIKTKEVITTLIAMVEPTLMIMAAGFLFMIISAFILPIYTHMNQIN